MPVLQAPPIPPQSPGIMSSWQHLLQTAEPRGHLVQFYDSDEGVLKRNVSQYLLQGLQRGDRLFVIATPAHRGAFVRQLRAAGADPEAAVREERMLLLDAQETLDGFMLRGQPDWERFQNTVGAAVR